LVEVFPQLCVVVLAGSEYSDIGLTFGKGQSELILQPIKFSVFPHQCRGIFFDKDRFGLLGPANLLAQVGLVPLQLVVPCLLSSVCRENTHAFAQTHTHWYRHHKPKHAACTHRKMRAHKRTLVRTDKRHNSYSHTLSQPYTRRTHANHAKNFGSSCSWGSELPSCVPAQVDRGRCIEEACEKRLAVGRPGALACARARRAPPRSMVARCSVLQCVGVWFSVVQYIAGWCSVVQCVPETLPCVCCGGLGTPTALEGVLCQHCIDAARAGLIFMCHFT